MKEQNKDLPTVVAEIIKAQNLTGKDLEIFMRGYEWDLSYLREMKVISYSKTTLDERREQDRKNSIYVLGLKTKDNFGGK
ncbi:hypothetical protein COV11_03215 [Candidatus Woesearchaeota archaeon CG10_big_fil_rev_8_21_14_0_10_30_7]|nr:MAG: hypothetical protein COV11_03215 [Candidatus Woesearchaeota archaeon CG10_big_fil_rev_8_21_14_0_10_30_7]